MRNLIKKEPFEITMDRAFETVIQSCRKIKRPRQSGTWITREMEAAYIDLHQLGYAHSLEVWQDNQLAGGLYGIGLGKVFFGESMFSRVSNASKYGFIQFVRILKDKGFLLIDCQQDTQHLRSLGATTISRVTFLEALRNNIFQPTILGPWTEEI
jgi:leucyl/phenylalanyl-tRNA--protein transferase